LDFKINNEINSSQFYDRKKIFLQLFVSDRNDHSNETKSLTVMIDNVAPSKLVYGVKEYERDNLGGALRQLCIASRSSYIALSNELLTDEIEKYLIVGNNDYRLEFSKIINDLCKDNNIIISAINGFDGYSMNCFYWTKLSSAKCRSVNYAHTEVEEVWKDRHFVIKLSRCV